MTTGSTTTTSTRARIIQAASNLFYAEGIRAVSVDAVAERAGVTKKTLYYHFRSKDELVEAYLVARDSPNLAAFARWFDRAEGALPERVAAVFLAIGRQARNKNWKGCGFLRTAAELANMPGHPAIKVGAAHKKRVEDWFAACLAEAGLSNAVVLGRQLRLLMDGLFSALLFHRDPAYAEAAADAARRLVLSTSGGDQRSLGTPSESFVGSTTA
ncbi:MAG: helix-turn-helix domain-containing protein [Paracoccaceae bacterium]